MYGMGERSVVQIAEALDSGLAVKDITFIDGTVYKTRNREDIYDAIELPHFEEIKSDKRAYAKSFYTQYCNTDPFSGKRLFETYDEKCSLCRTRRRNRCQNWKWIRYMTFRICGRIIRVTRARRRTCHFRSEIQPDQQPGLLWRMQFLRTDVSSGEDHTGAQPGVYLKRSKNDHGRSGI